MNTEITNAETVTPMVDPATGLPMVAVQVPSDIDADVELKPETVTLQ